jgi:transcriptional regulator with XRE-family HTH domain
MDRAQEEEVLRITAQYVAELQAGRQPRLGDYLARYPQYAGAISEFAAYYHAVEADLPGEALSERDQPLASSLPQLSDSSRMALERAWKRISPRELAPGNINTTLQVVANKQGLSLSQVASEAGLSDDIVEKLLSVQPTIKAATIPQEVFRRLARVLHQPLDAIQAYFGLARRLQVAETATAYDTGSQDAQEQSFREAIEQSDRLSDEQRTVWRDILAHEGL